MCSYAFLHAYRMCEVAEEAGESSWLGSAFAKALPHEASAAEASRKCEIS